MNKLFVTGLYLSLILTPLYNLSLQARSSEQASLMNRQTKSVDSVSQIIENGCCSPETICSKEEQKMVDQYLLYVIANKNIRQIKSALQMGANPNCLVSVGSWELYDATTFEERMGKSNYFGEKPCCYETILIKAMRLGLVTVGELLVAAGADVNAEAYDGTTALMQVAQTGNIKLYELLVKTGAHINHADNKGYTPLMHAIENDKNNVAKKLISAGADVNTSTLHSNGWKRTLDLAIEKNNQEIVTLLKAAGAKSGAEWNAT